jgi:hypothetical protein
VSNHLRHCPKHRKPLPCPHCAWIAKPALVPTPEIVAEPAQTHPAKVTKSIVTNRELLSQVQAGTRQKRVLVPVEQVYCMRHAKKHPCPRCEERTDFWIRFAITSQQSHALNKLLHGEWTRVAEKANVRPVPPVGDWKSIESAYDTEQFRYEINTGLRYAKKVLGDFPGKGFDELKQITEIEIWLASKKYGTKMNGAIAYTIAKNQAGRFLKDQIREQMITVENPNGSIALDDFGKPMKISRFLSFDDKGTEDDGEPREISVAEEAIAVAHDGEQKKAWMDDIRRKIPLLEKLVSGWFGAKRAVGEALLDNPECSVRDIPGVPKSTAARVRLAVLAEFRAIVDDSPVPQSTDSAAVN